MPLLQLKPVGFSLGNLLFNVTVLPLMFFVGVSYGQKRADKKNQINQSTLNTLTIVFLILSILVWFAMIFPIPK
jgi:hypothetical protein